MLERSELAENATVQEGERVDFAKSEKEAYEKYKHVLKVNAQQVARKNAESWRSFFSLIKAKKERNLPKWFKPRPPGYLRDEGGKYKLIIVIRNDRYEVNESERTIYLKDFKLALGFKGKLKWRGKKGRLGIIYNDARESLVCPHHGKSGECSRSKRQFEGWCGLGHC